MKKLIVATVIALSSGLAFADSDMNSEFYDGQASSTLNSVAVNTSANLHQEGNFINIDTKVPASVAISQSSLDTNIFLEGNYDV